MNIEICGLTVKYINGRNDVLALNDLYLNVEDGETCAVIGPSGCGKTTLMYVLSGIIKDFKGAVLLDGSHADPKKQSIGLIPQSYGLLEWADVYHNAVLGVEITRPGVKINGKEADACLKSVGLSGLGSKYPCQLSGGQRQRVSIARTFLMKPDVLLMDEPFSALDAISREEMQDLLLNMLKEHPVTSVIITHSIEEALYLGQKIAVMSPAPGYVREVVRNPLFGKKELRLDSDYYSFVIELRKKAGALWQTCENKESQVI